MPCFVAKRDYQILALLVGHLIGGNLTCCIYLEPMVNLAAIFKSLVENISGLVCYELSVVDTASWPSF